jgi:hypothetical protein
MRVLLVLCLSFHLLALSEIDVRESLTIEAGALSKQDKIRVASSYRVRVTSLRRMGSSLASKNPSCSLIHLEKLILDLDQAESYYNALTLVGEGADLSYFYVEFMVRMWGAYREFDAILECSEEGLRKYSDFSI